MGMLYSWATKEYLLWEMTIGQIIMYIQEANNINSGKADKPELTEDKLLELEQIRENMKKKYGDI
jgi:hypothetical protein